MKTTFKKYLFLIFFVSFCVNTVFVDAGENPFDAEIQAKISVLQNSQDIAERARAAESLGYMRAYNAENVLINALSDEAVEVRRNTVLSLGWCGSRAALKPL
ncbi:MAG: HEAT repeat domain-containing protein, partial [Planctomycetaceae bacterium]|nr:HEAT repeat domain-containing protein [Planctomycetaceae bacterium]